MVSLDIHKKIGDFHLDVAKALHFRVSQELYSLMMGELSLRAR